MRGCRQAPGSEGVWCPLFVPDIVIQTRIVEGVLPAPAPTVPEH